MYKVTKNAVTTENAQKHVAFLNRNEHTIDLIHYLHDLNNQLKHGKKLQHYVFDTEEDYYPYFKTNIDKVRCRRTYRFKKSEFQYYNFGLMLGNDSMKVSNNKEYFLFENGSIIVEPDTNTVLLQYQIGADLLLIKEENNQLQFYTRPEDEYLQYLKNKAQRIETESYMIHHHESLENDMY